MTDDITRYDAVEAYCGALSCAPGEALQVLGDRDQLEQVLNNLIGNAMKYSSEGGPVDVSVVRAGERQVELRVRDRGIGIRPEELARVFGLFYRSPDRLARDVGGMGLGLYISKEIVDRHNGRIWAESEVGTGTTFHVTLPAAAPAGARMEVVMRRVIVSSCSRKVAAQRCTS